MQRKWKRRWRRLAKIVLPPVAAGMLLLSAYSAAYANPIGGTVASGAASISANGSAMTVNQSTNKAIINWQSFSIGSGETVQFVQPGANSVALNRVVGNNPSAIYGTLTANGKVFLVNPNGVLFAKGAQVSTGGLVASTLDISDSNFLNGNYVFSGSGAGHVINQGNITAASEAVFLGPQVANEGVVAAKVVGLGAGSKVRLDFSGDQLLSLTVDTGAANSSAANSGTITANGGTVVMSAGTADSLLNTVVNNTGIIRAQTVNNVGGVIKLLGNTVNAGGTLDASAPTVGDGGFIETSGDKVNIADSAVITTKAASGKTGTWLIDPDGFTVAAVGGDITGAALSSRLASNNVTIASTQGTGTGGNINVNDVVNWSSNTTLKLDATNDININRAITATGERAGLVLKYGGDYHILTPASFSGAVLDESGKPVAKQDTSGGVYGSVTLKGDNATLKINGQEYTLIHDMADFEKINQAGGVGYFALAQNLDASGTTYTKAVVDALDGTFAGLGHTISDLTINSTQQYVGLFGIVGQNQASVNRDIGLTNVNISSTSSLVGGLAGLLWPQQDGISINNVYVTGNITGNGSVGGIIGRASTNTTITNAFFSGNIYSYGGGSNVGGLVGNALGDNIIIRNAHANADIDMVTDWYVSGVGGLIGNFDSDGEVSGTYATGNISIAIPNQYADSVGGLIGSLSDGGNLSKSFASVNIYIKPQYSEASEGVGGLVGTLSGGVIDNVYAKGDITIDAASGSGFGVNSVGGLVGLAEPAWPSGENVITNAAAYGNVTAGGASSWVGGFIGWNDDATISNSQAYGNVSGSNTVGGFVGGNNGNISNSAAHGVVTGGYGFAGVNNPDATISNSYYNGEANGTGVGQDYDGNSDTTGLTKEQFKDLQYYLDGTIDQVLADRAARQALLTATKQVAVQQSTGQQASRQADTVSQPGQAMGNAWQNLLDTLNPGTLWQSATNQNASAPGSARIQSVQANGVEYQLEDNSTDANTNAGGNSTDKKQ